MRSAIIILSGWRFLSAFLRKKSPLGVFSRADPELSSYPFWLKLKTLSHPIWGYLSEYFRHLLSFSDLFLKTAYVAVWTLLAGCVIQEMGTFRLFSKTATWSGVAHGNSIPSFTKFILVWLRFGCEHPLYPSRTVPGRR